MDLKCLLNHKPTLNLGKYFDEAQRHKNGHPAIISSMYKLSRKANQEVFTLEFIQHLTSALVQKDKSPYAIIVLEFAAKFCCHHSKYISEDAEDFFLTCVINFVTKVGDGKLTVVRLRVCEFISLLLSSMSAEATIDEELFENITQCMLDRAKDKLPSVRVHAFAALQRLQDPQDTTCPVTKTFIFHLECDPSAEVRKNILKNIAITQHSLPAIISRSRDVNEMVRKETYQTISKIKTKRLRIRQLQELLTNGLNDPSELVRDHVMKKLIPTWFEECERDYVKLVELFYVQTYSLETIDSLLLSLFKRRASADLLDIVKTFQNPNKVIPLDSLSAGKVVMWLNVVKYFRNPPSGVKIDQDDVVSILPGLTFYANYLREFFKKVEPGDVTSEYIFMRLLDLVLHFSLTDDEKGRDEIKELCREILLSPKTKCERLVKLVAKLITFVEPDVDCRLVTITLIVSDIHHPLEEDEEAGFSKIINSTAVSTNTDGLEFFNVEHLPKCLWLLAELLRAKDINHLHPVLDTLVGTFLENCFEFQDGYISSLTISVLSLICLKDEACAKKYFIKFLFYLETDTLELSSLEAIFDQLIVYGFDVCQLSIDKKVPNADQEKSKLRAPSLDSYDDPTVIKQSMKHLLNRLTARLISPVLQIRSVACQGLAKLLLCNRLRSSFVLAKLVMLWFSPELGSDSCISQPLGIFFELYSKKVANAGEVILNSVIPTLDHLTSRVCDSHFITVDPLRAVNLLLNTLKNAPVKDGPCYHYQAANVICDELLSRGVKSESQMFICLTKCFYHLELKKSDKDYADELLEKLPVVLNKIDQLKEKSVKKIAVSFFSKLNSLWGMKKRNPVLVNKLKESNVSTAKDDGHVSTEYESSHADDTANITLRRNNRFSKVVSEPIIEEFSASENEDENGSDETSDRSRRAQNGFDGNSNGFEMVPGTPESEDDESEEEEDYEPPTRRRHRKLEF